MSIGPLSPKAVRGSSPTAFTSVTRDEQVERLWTFLRGLKAKNLAVYGEGASAGKMLVASDDSGNVTFSDTLPATTLARTGGTITETATLVAAASGEYFVTVYTQCTTAGVGGTLTVTFTHTDDIGLTTTGTIATIGLAATNRDDGFCVLRCSGGGIDYSLTVTGSVGGPIYACHISIAKVR